MQRFAAQRGEEYLKCACGAILMAQVPLVLQELKASELTPRSPWSEGDMVPGPLTQEQLFEEYPNLYAIHCSRGWRHK